METKVVDRQSPSYTAKSDNPSGLCAQSKCKIIAFAVCSAVGSIILVVGGIIFGPTANVGFIASIVLGGTSLSVAAGGMLWMVVCHCKNSDKKKSGQSPHEEEESSHQSLHRKKSKTFREVKGEGFEGSAEGTSYEGKIDGMPATKFFDLHNIQF